MATTRARFGVAVVGFGLICVAGAGSTRPPMQARLVFAGYVQVTSAADRCDTLVSVADPDALTGDAKVGQAFLLQTDEPLALDLAGPAVVVFDRTSLVVSFASGDDWTFVVRGRRPDADVAGTTRLVWVMGLAHYWGRGVAGQKHGDLVTRLATGHCDAGARSDPACQHCESGGPGSESCEAPTCSVVCGDDTYACCSETDGCRCCRNTYLRASPPVPADLPPQGIPGAPSRRCAADPLRLRQP